MNTNRMGIITYKVQTQVGPLSDWGFIILLTMGQSPRCIDCPILGLPVDLIYFKNLLECFGMSVFHLCGLWSFYWYFVYLFILLFPHFSAIPLGLHCSIHRVLQI